MPWPQPGEGQRRARRVDPKVQRALLDVQRQRHGGSPPEQVLGKLGSGGSGGRSGVPQVRRGGSGGSGVGHVRGSRGNGASARNGRDGDDAGAGGGSGVGAWSDDDLSQEVPLLPQPRRRRSSHANAIVLDDDDDDDVDNSGGGNGDSGGSPAHPQPHSGGAGSGDDSGAGTASPAAPRPVPLVPLAVPQQRGRHSRLDDGSHSGVNTIREHQARRTELEAKIADKKAELQEEQERLNQQVCVRACVFVYVCARALWLYLLLSYSSSSSYFSAFCSS